MQSQLWYTVIFCFVVTGLMLRKSRQSSSFLYNLLKHSGLMAGILFVLLAMGTGFAAPLPGDDGDDAVAQDTRDSQTPQTVNSQTAQASNSQTDQTPDAPQAQTTRKTPRDVDNVSTTRPRDFRDSSGMITTKGGFMTGISRREGLLGDPFGFRKWLSKYGASLNVTETSEVLGNFAGGTRKSAEYDGLTQMIFQLDTQRAFHWYGGTFNASVLHIHGNNLSALTLDSIQTSSGIEADRGLRLWELWYDQKFGETNRFGVRLGQMSLDQEYMISQNALVFVNTMFGWPAVPSYDMPGGGPAYPLSALGVRFHARPTNSLTVLAGVYNGSPASPNGGDSQSQNDHGTSFRLDGGVLAIAELQYIYPALGSMVYPGKREPMPRVYKLGAWYDTEKFADQRYDTNGVSLASPSSNGNPRMHRGDYSIYAVADQMLWQYSKDADRSLNAFVRAMGTPQTDRNLLDFSLNAGLTFNEPIIYRDDDVLGIGMGYAHVSGQAAAYDRDFGLLNPGYPIRNGETFIEATYRYQLRVWCQLQPTFQYVFNPGAGVLNPNSSTPQKVQNEAVAGLRVNIAF